MFKKEFLTVGRNAVNVKYDTEVCLFNIQKLAVSFSSYTHEGSKVD